MSGREPGRDGWEVAAYRAALRLFASRCPDAQREDMVGLYRALLEDVGRRPGPRAVFVLRACADALRHGTAASTASRAIEPFPTGRGAMAPSDIGRDVRHGFRIVRRKPGFAAAVILTLALGIGASTSIFSVVDGVVFRPLAYAEPGRLVAVWETYPMWRGRPVLDALWDRIGLAWPEYATWREAQHAFAGVAAYAEAQVTVQWGREAERLDGVAVSTSLLDVLGVRPAQGRSFLPGEDGRAAPTLAMISHGLWTRRFGGDATVVGRSLLIEGTPFTIIGVLPRGFALSFASGRPDIWTPIGALNQSLSPSSHVYTGLARLRAGVTAAEALAETETLLRGTRPPQRLGARLVPLQESIVAGARPSLLLLFAAAAVLLVIACLNVAVMLLGEASTRRQDIATRAALGATPLRLARQVVVESLVLSGLAAALGVCLAAAGTRVLVALAPADLPRLDEVAVDGRVLLFVVALGLLTGVAAAVLPAFALVRGHVPAVVGSGIRETRRHGRAKPWLMLCGQLTVVGVVLVMAALLARSLLRVEGVDPGFRTDRLLTAVVDLPRHYGTVRAIRAFHEGLLSRLRAIPGVDAVSGVTVAPFTGDRSSQSVGLEGLPERAAKPEAQGRAVLPDYFPTMDIPLLAGRIFVAGRREMIVSERMARMLWPDRSALGQRAALRDEWYSIVGVVGDVLEAGARAPVEPTFYVGLADAHEPQQRLRLLLRTSADPLSIAPTLRRVVREWDAAVPLTDVMTMEGLERRFYATERYRTFLMTAYAALALLLAAAGVFGVTTQLVGRRWREFGVRLALGASPRGLWLGIVGPAATAAAAGFILSGLVGMALGPVVSRFLHQVTPLDPLSYAAAAALLGAATLAASWLPARRAARLDPSVVLRCE